MGNTMANHDYTEPFWGHQISNLNPQADGTLNMMGHGENIKKGDTLTMNMRSGKIGKFKVKSIAYFRDPADMFRMNAELIEYVATGAG